MSAEAIDTLVNSWYAASLAWGRAHPFLGLILLVVAAVLALRLALWAGVRLVALAIALVVAIPVRVARLVSARLPYCRFQASASLLAAVAAWTAVWVEAWEPWQAILLTAALAAGIALRVRMHGRARDETPCPGLP